jgi:hypothetical protein
MAFNHWQTLWLSLYTPNYDAFFGEGGLYEARHDLSQSERLKAGHRQSAPGARSSGKEIRVMTEKIKSEVISRRRVFSLLGLAASGLVLATIPVSPQVTPGGVELSVDQAQAVTYRRARVTARRVNRRAYRHTRRAVRRGAY